MKPPKSILPLLLLIGTGLDLLMKALGVYGALASDDSDKKDNINKPVDKED